jgi:hypothetical protein
MAFCIGTWALIAQTHLLIIPLVGQTWGDNYPTEENCPIDVIQHHAQACNVIVSDDVISFARSMWNEGNLTEKIK